MISNGSVKADSLLHTLSVTHTQSSRFLFFAQKNQLEKITRNEYYEKQAYQN